MIEQHSFIIPIAQLRRKVEMHSSRIGMHRGDESNPHFLDKYALTEGEGFMFDDYLKEATGKTYDWIKAFGRNVQNAFRVYPDGNLIKMSENEGVTISINGVQKMLEQAYVPVTAGMYTVAEIPLIPQPVGKKKFGVILNIPNVVIGIGSATRVNYTLRIDYTTIADGIFEDHERHEEVRTTTTDETINGQYSLEVELTYRQFEKEIKSIDSIMIVVTDIVSPSRTFKKGDWIELTKVGGSVVYGLVTNVVNGTAVAEWMIDDMRNTVVYEVELPDWQDRNMLPAVQEHLENALAFYILYRWFETVQDDTATLYGGRWHKPESQADRFLAKWEEAAHAAQLGLNSERRILQRKSTWL